MEAYTGFAYVYDKFMSDMPYQQWAGLIAKRLAQKGVLPGKSQIAELGCGTGIFSIELAKRGYGIIGIDNSEDMLVQANMNMCELEAASDNEADNLQIVYTLQDMTDFEIPYEADGVVSVCDSMNYLVEADSLKKCFKSVWRALRHGGVFIFDMKKEAFYRDVLADNTFSDCMEDCTYIWNNYYNADEMLNEYELSVFVKCDDGRYERYDEYHVQRAYMTEDVMELLRGAGFIDAEAFEEDAGEDNHERIYFRAVKP